MSGTSAAAVQKAAVYCRHAIQGVKMRPQSLPGAPGPGTVLVRVSCAGLNPVDAKFVLCDKLPSFLQPAARVYVDGHVPGFDFSGEVISAPLGSPYKTGDCVYGTVPPLVGSLAEQILAPEDHIAPKPQRLTFQEAACLPLVGLTSLQALREDHGIRPGHRLLILGASGGVGHMAVQVGKALGAHVTGVCSGRNLNFVSATCGADEVLDYTQGGDIVQRLRDIADSAGPFDLVFDCVSSHDRRDMEIRYEERIRSHGEALLRGTYVCIGGTLPSWVAAGLKRKVGISLFRKGRELFWVRFPRSSGLLRDLAAWAEDGRVRPHVAQVVPFSEEGVQSGFAAINERRVVGKIAVDLAGQATQH